jgi:hypothetical protein
VIEASSLRALLGRRDVEAPFAAAKAAVLARGRVLA